MTGALSNLVSTRINSVPNHILGNIKHFHPSPFYPNEQGLLGGFGQASSLEELITSLGVVSSNKPLGMSSIFRDLFNNISMWFMNDISAEITAQKAILELTRSNFANSTQSASGVYQTLDELFLAIKKETSLNVDRFSLTKFISTAIAEKFSIIKEAVPRGDQGFVFENKSSRSLQLLSYEYVNQGGVSHSQMQQVSSKSQMPIRNSNTYSSARYYPWEKRAKKEGKKERSNKGILSQIYQSLTSIFLCKRS